MITGGKEMYRIKKEILNISLLALFILFLNTQLASAYPISPIDFSAPPISPTNPSAVFEYFSADDPAIKMGELTVNEFYINDTSYIYELVLDPADDTAHDISYFTISGIKGFSDQAGYSYEDAKNAIGYNYAGLYSNDLTQIAGEDFFNVTYASLFQTLSFEIGTNLTSDDPTQSQLKWPPISSIGNEVKKVSFFFESSTSQDLYNLNYKIVNGETIILPAPIPEPGTMMLLLTGIGCITGMRFKNIFRSKNRAN